MMSASGSVPAQRGELRVGLLDGFGVRQVSRARPGPADAGEAGALAPCVCRWDDQVGSMASRSPAGLAPRTVCSKSSAGRRMLLAARCRVPRYARRPLAALWPGTHFQPTGRGRRQLKCVNNFEPPESWERRSVALVHAARHELTRRHDAVTYIFDELNRYVATFNRIGGVRTGPKGANRPVARRSTFLLACPVSWARGSCCGFFPTARGTVGQYPRLHGHLMSTSSLEVIESDAQPRRSDGDLKPRETGGISAQLSPEGWRSLLMHTAAASPTKDDSAGALWGPMLASLLGQSPRIPRIRGRPSTSRAGRVALDRCCTGALRIREPRRIPVDRKQRRLLRIGDNVGAGSSADVWLAARRAISGPLASPCAASRRCFRSNGIRRGSRMRSCQCSIGSKSHPNRPGNVGLGPCSDPGKSVAICPRRDAKHRPHSALQRSSLCWASRSGVHQQPSASFSGSCARYAQSHEGFNSTITAAVRCASDSINLQGACRTSDARAARDTGRPFRRRLRRSRSRSHAPQLTGQAKEERWTAGGATGR